jgi:hypothetical protein
MKQKDLAMILLIAGIAAVVSLFVSRAVFSSTGARKQTAEVVDQISTQFQNPSNKYFNENAIDPTQLIQIGDNANPDPIATNQ